MGGIPTPAVGARGVIHYGEEASYGVLATLNKVLRFTSESISNEIAYLVSNELRADRSRATSVRGSASIAGDINVEQNIEGQTTMLKNAYGDDYLSLQYVDGGIAAVTSASYTSPAVTIDTDRDLIAEGFINTGGDAVIVGRDANTGDLTSEQFAYTGIAGAGNDQFTGVSGITANYTQGSRIFLYDSTNYSAIYTHVMDVSADLLPGISIEVLRDIAAFIYTGCKIDNLTETFPENDICTAVYSLLGKVEWSMGLLDQAASIGDVYVVLRTQEEYDGFPSGGGTLMIGRENDITYTGKAIVAGEYRLTGIPGAGDNSIESDHEQYEPVSLQTTTGSGSPSSTDPLTSFMGAFYLDGDWTEIMSGEYTINNNLFPDKIPFGFSGRSQLPEQQREVSGMVNIEFDDMIIYSKFVNDIPAKIEFALIDDRVEGEIGSTGVYRQKYVVFPRVKYTGSTPVIADESLITADMPFDAYPDLENNLPEVYLVIVNTESSI